MAHRILLLHPSRLDGENRGVYEQHIASMKALFAGGDPFEVLSIDPLHPSFPDAVLRADLVVVHMLAASEIEAVIRLRRQRGLATIFEISDNILDLGPWLPARHTMRSPLVRQQILFHAAIADAVQVYAPGLAELFGHIHASVAQLDPYVPIRPMRSAGDRFVVGWGGSTTHEEDLAAIAPVLIEFFRSHRDATFAFAGNLAMFARLFDSVPREQVRVREFSDYDGYLDFVSTWDVGVAPLRESAFNAGRTDTKFATYAACGAAAVLEDSDVYRRHSERSRLFKTAADLMSALESLYADRARVVDLASRAHAWVSAERSAERLRAQRTAVYARYLPATSCGPLDLSEDGTARRLVETPEREGSDRVAAVRAIVAEHPAYARARLVLSDLLDQSGDPAGALEVLDAAPFPAVLASVAAERQVSLALRIRPEVASQYAARIDSPAARIRIAHRTAERREFFRALLQCQPFDYLALAATLRDVLGDENVSPDRRAELESLCLRACMISPALVPNHLRPKSLARFLPA